MNHKELAVIGASWLRDEYDCSLILREPRTSGWNNKHRIPDVLGVARGTGHIRIIEVKVSVSDFVRDERKSHVIWSHQRWFLVPEEIKDGVMRRWPADDGLTGLLVYRDGQVHEQHPARFTRLVNPGVDVVFRLLAQAAAKTGWDNGPAFGQDTQKWLNTCVLHIHKNPGCNVKEIVVYCNEHPFGSDAAARTRLTKLVKTSKVKGIRIDETEAPARFYPT